MKLSCRATLKHLFFYELIIAKLMLLSYISFLQTYYQGNSHGNVFSKKGVLSYFTKFTGKHLCRSLVFKKDAGLRLSTLLKNSSQPQHWCFPVNFEKLLRIPIFTEHLRWLLSSLLITQNTEKTDFTCIYREKKYFQAILKARCGVWDMFWQLRVL